MRNKQIQAAYRNLFNTPDGKVVLQDLDQKFNGSLLKKTEGLVDPNASLVAIGKREVIVHINAMRKHDAPT